MPLAISSIVAAVVDRGTSNPQSSAVNDRGYNTSRKARNPQFTECLQLGLEFQRAKVLPIVMITDTRVISNPLFVLYIHPRRELPLLFFLYRQPDRSGYGEERTGSSF